MAAGARTGNLLRRILARAAFAVVVLFLGVASALWMTRRQLARGGVENGPWHTNEHIGSSAADAYLRAGVALGGLLALNKSETVYFTAFADADGAPLLSSCVYRVAGRDPATRWWSITAYAADNFLIAEAEGRFSVDKARVERDADGSFALLIGGEQQPGNWISAGPPGRKEPFSLTLRLYNPDPAVLADLAGVALPRIVKERCT